MIREGALEQSFFSLKVEEYPVEMVIGRSQTEKDSESTKERESSVEQKCRERKESRAKQWDLTLDTRDTFPILKERSKD